MISIAKDFDLKNNFSCKKVVVGKVKIREVDEHANNWTEFCEDIRKNGVQIPIVARRMYEDSKDTGFVELIDGGHRRRAAEIADLETIPCHVSKGPVSDADCRILQLTLNANRFKQTRKQEREAIKLIIAENPDITHDELCSVFSRDKQTMANLMGLTRLIPEAEKLLNDGKIPETSAIALSRCDESVQKTVFQDGKSLLQLAEDMPVNEFADLCSVENKKHKKNIPSTERPILPATRHKKEIVDRWEMFKDRLERDPNNVKLQVEYDCLTWTLRMDDASLKLREKPAKKRKPAALSQLKAAEERIKQLEEIAEKQGINISGI